MMMDALFFFGGVIFLFLVGVKTGMDIADNSWMKLLERKSRADKLAQHNKKGE